MSPPSPCMKDQTSLRRQLKQARLALNERTRREADAKAIARIIEHPRFRRSLRVAAYVGSKGEPDPMPALNHAAETNKTCYLPVLHPFRSGQLWFCRWHPGDKLTPNRFGIPEPTVRPGSLIPARNLDLVIVPLLGFDDRCRRIGMGGGYYDRSFAFRRRFKRLIRPFMLGLAYEVQRVDQLDAQPWDVPLDAVVTAQKLYCRHDNA